MSLGTPPQAVSPEVMCHDEAMSYYFTRAELWLNNGANHAAKLVTLLALAHADEALSSGQLATYVSLMSDGEMPFADGSIASLADTLEKTGGVEICETTAIVSQYPRQVKGFKITEEGVNFGVAWAGQLLDWQFRHPNLPLLRVLGSTSTKHEGVYSPTLRMLIFSDLVERSDDIDGPSIGGLAEASPASFNARQQAVETLQREGIVTLHSQQRDNNRLFKIIQSTYRRTHSRAKSFEGLKPQTQLTFRALEIAFGVKDTWGVDEFMDLVTQISQDSDVDLAIIRKSIQQALAPSAKAFKGYIAPLNDGQPYEKHSIVKLVDDVRQPISELVKVVDGLAGENLAVIEEGHQKAQQIMTDSDVVGFLINGAHQDSSHVYKEADKRRLHIVRIIEENPGLTTAQITDIYREESSRKIGLHAVSESINNACAKGMIGTSQITTHPYKDKKLRTLSLPELHR